jgi:hypothetical protein
MKNLFFILFLALSTIVNAQVAINTKGMLFPRMTMAQRNAIASPAAGLMIYQTDNSPGLYYNSGTSGSPIWVSAGAGSAWNLIGNSSINSSVNFIGTTDNQSLRFRVNNTWSGEMNPVTRNLFLGLNAGISNTTGHSNIAIGTDALKINTNRSNLVAVGDSAMYWNGSVTFASWEATGNSAFGSKALFSNVGGFNNTGNGFMSLYTNQGSSNTAIGYRSIFSNEMGNSNTASGVEALFSNYSGSLNTAEGYQALYFNTSGNFNTASGYRALFYNTSGLSNCAYGTRALYRNTAQSNLVAVGDSALYYNGYSSSSPEEASANTAIGSKALYSNTTGSKNTSGGFHSLYGNISGNYNTAVGYSALPDNNSGSWNTALGLESGIGNTDGQYNTFIGANTSGSPGITNATAIGSNTQVTQSNSLVLGNNANVGVGTPSPVTKLDISGSNGWDLVNGEGDFRIGNSQFRIKMGVALDGGGAGASGIMQYGHPSGYNVLALGSQGNNLLFINGNSQKVGIGTDNPAAMLDVRGTLSVVDGTQGAGRMLTSDANGLAFWASGNTHSIGESYGGGIVFYVYDNGQHGLIAATTNQGAGISWNNGTDRITGTSGDGVGAGEMNTAMIVTTQINDNQAGNFAAKVCADYSVTVNGVTYGDWYLPSKLELNLLYLQKNLVGGFANDHCCSSTEANSAEVWMQAFIGGVQAVDGKWKGYNVRAIRAF